MCVTCDSDCDRSRESSGHCHNKYKPFKHTPPSGRQLMPVCTSGRVAHEGCRIPDRGVERLCPAEEWLPTLRTGRRSGTRVWCSSRSCRTRRRGRPLGRSTPRRRSPPASHQWRHTAARSAPPPVPRALKALRPHGQLVRLGRPLRCHAPCSRRRQAPDIDGERSRLCRGRPSLRPVPRAPQARRRDIVAVAPERSLSTCHRRGTRSRGQRGGGSKREDSNRILRLVVRLNCD